MKQSTVEKAAKAAHEMKALFCKQVGDDSQPSWEDAPDWMRGSAIDSVLAIANTGVEPRANFQHEKWRSHKLVQGWRYGPKKDDNQKTHPCLVEFDDLPAWQQSMDMIFLQTVLGVWSKEEPEDYDETSSNWMPF
jgi:hypothetical protein